MPGDRAATGAGGVYFRRKCGLTPVLLCDDVLGELDPARRACFWASLEDDTQVIATGTNQPVVAGGWQVLQVAGGKVTA